MGGRDSQPLVGENRGSAVPPRAHRGGVDEGEEQGEEQQQGQPQAEAAAVVPP